MIKRTILLGAVALTLAACEPRDTGQPQPRVEPATTNAANVDALCRFFVGRLHEVLLTAAAEGTVTTNAELSGVPSELREAAKRYYRGETLNSTINDSRRKRLDDKYANVMNHCAAAGWHE